MSGLRSATPIDHTKVVGTGQKADRGHQPISGTCQRSRLVGRVKTWVNAVMSNSAIEISIVIPCFQSAGSICGLLEKIDSVLKSIGKTYEIILVNDCSPDNFSSLAEAIIENNKNVVYIELAFNVGQFKATLCGLRHSRGNFVITMDDDSQHPPSGILSLYKRISLDSELDAVVAKFSLNQHPVSRNLGSYVLWSLERLAFGLSKDMRMTSFRCLRKSLVSIVSGCNHRRPAIGVLIMKNAKGIACVPIDHMPRSTGESGYTLMKLISSSLDVLASILGDRSLFCVKNNKPLYVISRILNGHLS